MRIQVCTRAILCSALRRPRPWGDATHRAGAERYASRCCWRSGVIRTTFQARPTCCIPPMIAPDGSSSQRRRPWTAERGKAWWLWCQASPSEASESHQTLVELVVGREPAAAVEVADRVDRPGDVVDEEDPHEAAPEQPGEGADDAPGQQRTRARRDPQREHDQREEAAVEQPHARGRPSGRGRTCAGRPGRWRRTASRRGRARARRGRCRGRRAASAGRPPRRCARGACGGRRPSRSPAPGPPSSPAAASAYSTGLWVWKARWVSRRW